MGGAPMGGVVMAGYAANGTAPIDFVFNACRRTLTRFIAWRNRTRFI